jgi:hypothetical protein
VRTLTRAELNRTLLARQLLDDRRLVSPAEAVTRLVALQAQYAPSPYIALWTRLRNLSKSQVTGAFVRGSLVKATSFRTTLHVMSRAEFPFIAAGYVESQRGRTEGLGVDIESLRASIPDSPLTSAELNELAHRVLGTDDVWTVAFAWRAIPFVRLAPVGPWPHTKPPPVRRWLEPLPDAMEASRRVVRAYLAAYGPATREDIAQFTDFRLRQIDPGLEGMRTFEDEAGRTLYDVPRARIASADASTPVRFLPAFDSMLLAHRDRSRIVADEHLDAVYNRKNATMKNTFTVRGHVAGTWRVERQRGRLAIVLDAFDPLPVRARGEVERERERLLAF